MRLIAEFHPDNASLSAYAGGLLAYLITVKVYRDPSLNVYVVRGRVQGRLEAEYETDFRADAMTTAVRMLEDLVGVWGDVLLT
jgi:hypothetical protein